MQGRRATLVKRLSRKAPVQPKLQDIATHLGVSAATVSNALNDRGRVSPDLRDRIRATAASLGYNPSPQARALRTGRSGVIGLVLPDISNPLFPAMAQAVEAAAARAGFGVLIADSMGDTHAQTAALHRLTRQGADGIIVIPRRGTRVMDMPLPLAVIDTPSTPGNAVASDHRGGGALAARHLVSLGHTQFLLIAESRDSTVQRDRISGMKSALPPGTTMATHWLEDGPLPAVSASAIIATSDLHALSALTALQRCGKRIPQDISIIGFDDHAFARAITPALTTVAQDTRALADAAIAHIMAQLNTTQTTEITVPMHLIHRESTAPKESAP